MGSDANVLVVGGGPAGAATAILLAEQGWRVLLMEQHSYPRHKVCGECVSAGSLRVLDALGVGRQFRQRAGPELRWLGWMSATSTVTANMPACPAEDYRYGHAMGRHSLDALLLERARAAGVEVIQPARLRQIAGVPGRFQCVYQSYSERAGAGSVPYTLRTVRVPLVIDAHGSCKWDPADPVNDADAAGQARVENLPRDLFAFKASFRNTKLSAGYLPVVALNGGYGGMVVADDGRTTIACCVRRDLLKRCRSLAPGKPAGAAVEAYLRDASGGIGNALDGAQREGSWVSVGPVRPGIRLAGRDGVFRVGNAAGETHPLVGEGIGMALQSATLLADHLTRDTSSLTDPRRIIDIQRSYAVAWRREFAARIRLSTLYAHIAMSPALAGPAGALMKRVPPLLTLAARIVGKARQPAYYTRSAMRKSG